MPEDVLANAKCQKMCLYLFVFGVVFSERKTESWKVNATKQRKGSYVRSSARRPKPPHKHPHAICVCHRRAGDLVELQDLPSDDWTTKQILQACHRAGASVSLGTLLRHRLRRFPLQPGRHPLFTTAEGVPALPLGPAVARHTHRRRGSRPLSLSRPSPGARPLQYFVLPSSAKLRTLMANETSRAADLFFRQNVIAARREVGRLPPSPPRCPGTKKAGLAWSLKGRDAKRKGRK